MLFILIFQVYSRRVNQLGQLLTREGQPIGNSLTITYVDESQTICNDLGYFLLKNQQFSVNVMDQFTQHFFPQLGQINFIIDNNETETIIIKGNIQQNAQILVNVSHPLNLGSIFLNISNNFSIEIQVMKLLVYNIEIIVQAEHFRNYTNSIDIYGTYEYNLGEIILIASEKQVSIIQDFECQSECYLMCAKYQLNPSPLYVLEGESSNGQVTFEGKLIDEWPQICLLYSESETGKIIRMKY